MGWRDLPEKNWGKKVGYEDPFWNSITLLLKRLGTRCIHQFYYGQV